MPILVRDFAADWLVRRTPQLRPQSLRNYRYQLDAYIVPLLGDVAMACLTRRLLFDTFAELRRRGLGEGTVRNVRARLSALCQDAIAADVLAINPLVGLTSPRYKRRHPPRVLDHQALEHYLATAERLRPDLHGLLCACAWGGLRVGEAMALQAHDRAGGTLHVRRSVLQTGQVMDSPKNGEHREVAIGPRLQGVLGAIPHPLWLFPSREGGGVRRYSAVWKGTKDVARAAGTLLISPHDLRHSFASQMVSEGASLEWIRRTLGHAHISITMDLYGRWLPMQAQPQLATR